MVSLTSQRPPVKTRTPERSLSRELKNKPPAEEPVEYDQLGFVNRSPAKTRSSRVLRFNPDTAELTILVTKGRKVLETAYSLERLACDFGTGYRLTKHVGHPGDQCETYHVHFGGEGDTCDCAGGSYSTPRTGKPCKHAAALLKLRTLGTL